MQGQLTDRLLWWCYHGTMLLHLSRFVPVFLTAASRLIYSCNSMPVDMPCARPSKIAVPCRIPNVCLRPSSKIWTYWTLLAYVNTAMWTLSKTQSPTLTQWQIPSDWKNSSYSTNLQEGWCVLGPCQLSASLSDVSRLQSNEIDYKRCSDSLFRWQ